MASSDKLYWGRKIKKAKLIHFMPPSMSCNSLFSGHKYNVFRKIHTCYVVEFFKILYKLNIQIEMLRISHGMLRISHGMLCATAYAEYSIRYNYIME